MRTSPFLVPAALFALLCLAASAPGEELTARDIMLRADQRDDGDNQTNDLEMILIDKHGSERERKLRMYRKDFGEDEYSLIFFLDPADVRNTGFLTYDYDGNETDDDQWLYLPALKKTKRIASTDKSGSFMGSDFSYADMSSREVDDYDHTLMKETEVKGVKVWQIQSVPRTEKEIEETGYTKSILFVRQDNYVIVRAVHWVEKGDELKYMEVVKLDQIDGIWVGTEVHMTTKKGKSTLHKTVIRASNVKFNQDLDDDIFTLRQLEKGAPG